jgi:fructokinase
LLIDLIQADEQPDGFISTNWSAMSAGGPMNSAVALGDLGADVHFLGRLSRDAFGAQLRGHIEGAGVALDLATESSQATSLAVVSLDDEGKASYTFHFSDTANFGWEEADLPALSSDDWLHIASLACVVSPGSDVLLDWSHGLTSGISYDINVRPTVITDPEEYWAKVRPWLRVVGQHKGILKASDEDVDFLAQVDHPGADPVDVLTEWVAQYGIGLGVVTLGPGGAVAVDAEGRRTSAKGFPTTVIDTVGAGDTFMAGFLDGYVGRKLDLASSLQRGAAAASIVCARRGAQPPTSAEVDALISASA